MDSTEHAPETSHHTTSDRGPGVGIVVAVAAVVLGIVAAGVVAVTLIAAGGYLWLSRAKPARPVVVKNDKTAPRDAAAKVQSNDEAESTKKKAESEIWGTIQDFELTERSGRRVSNEDLLGRPWAVSFIFTHCAGQCPRITTEMKKLQDRLEGKPVRLVSITVDPQRDTPERLRDYAKAFGADDEQWLFLTGDQREIYGLIQRSFKMPVKEIVGKDRKPGFEVLHTSNVMYVDATGRIRGKYNALKDVEMAELTRALETEAAALPAEAASGHEAKATEAPDPSSE